MNINLEFEREYGNYMRPAEEQAKNDGNLNPLRQGWKRPGGEVRSAAASSYFLNRFSNAVRASMGRAELGVEVSFSMRTLIE